MSDKKKIYRLTEEKLEAIKEKERDDAFNSAFSVMLSIPFKALEHEGFGKVRISRVLDKTLEILKEVEFGNVSVWKVKEELKEKQGIEVVVDKSLGIKRIS